MIQPMIYIISGGYIMRGCQSFSIRATLDNSMKTGHVVLPLRGFIRRENGRDKLTIDSILKRDQAIDILAGFDGFDSNVLIRGFIKSIDKQERIIVNIEDHYYLLRKQPIVLDKTNIKLKTVLELITNGTPIQPYTNVQLTFDKIKYSGSKAGLLEKIKDELNLTIYFTGEQMYAGLEGQDPLSVTHTVVYGKNLLENRVKSRFADTNPLEVEVVGKMPDGEEIKVIRGDAGGSRIKLIRYNVTDKKALATIGDEYINKMNWDGLEGTISMFLFKPVKPGDIIDYTNKNYDDDLTGQYLASGVTYSFSTEKGLKQQTKMGRKL